MKKVVVVNVNKEVLIDLINSCPRGIILKDYAISRLKHLRKQRTTLKDKLNVLEDAELKSYENWDGLSAWTQVEEENSTKRRAIQCELDRLDNRIIKLHEICKYLYTVSY